MLWMIMEVFDSGVAVDRYLLLKAARGWLSDGGHSVWFVFFFFQAEDGIRVLTVTGVQTCALPIFGSGEETHTTAPPASTITASSAKASASLRREERRPTFFTNASPAEAVTRYRVRSEERRGGKEGRTRGWPDP